MPDEYMPVAFSFKVSFDKFDMGSDVSFQEVSGIDSQIEVQNHVESGENQFVHNLPKGVKHSNLVLKRGIAPMSSSLVKWCQSVFDKGFVEPIRPMSLLVTLMNELQDPIRTWSFTNAFPVMWSIDTFNSTKNEVVIETIELSYAICMRIDN